MTDPYAKYTRLKFERPAERVLQIVLDSPGRLNATDARMHGELALVWRDIDADPDISVALIRGAGKAFSAGGDLELVEAMAGDFATLTRVWREARELVYNIINCSKPVVSAMHGPAVGAGLVCGLLADISIAAKTARIIDGHTRLGVAAGDHAAIIWPLLCGMAKAKYHLLLCEPVSGAEAERIGLVSLAVDEDELFDKALEVAKRLAAGSPTALRWTKHALNNWLRMMGPTFDNSLALEFLGFGGPDVREGLASLKEKRAPRSIPRRRSEPERSRRIPLGWRTTAAERVILRQPWTHHDRGVGGFAMALAEPRSPDQPLDARGG